MELYVDFYDYSTLVFIDSCIIYSLVVTNENYSFRYYIINKILLKLVILKHLT